MFTDRITAAWKRISSLVRPSYARMLTAEAEEECRRQHLADDISLARKGLLLMGGTDCLYVFSDFALLGESGAFHALLLLRVVFAVATGYLYLTLPSCRQPAQFDRFLLLVSFLIVAVAVPILLSRPAAYTHSFLLTLVFVLIMYILFPSRLPMRAAAPLILSAAALFVLHFYKDPLSAKALHTYWISFFLINAIGLYIAARNEKHRRRQFAAERKLEVGERHYRTLVENAHAIVYSLTADGVFTYVSPTWKEMLGHDTAEVLGRPYETFVHSDDIVPTRLFLEHVVTKGGRLDGIEYRVLHKYGNWRWHRMSAALTDMPDEAGGMNKIFIGVARDVTERKNMEEELRQAKEAAEEASRVKSEFLANTSHEIRTPLNAILGLADMARDNESDPGRRDTLDKIRESGTLLLGIISDILDLSRIEANRLSVDCAPFRPTDVLDYIQRTFAPQAGAKGLALTVSLDPAVPGRLCGDHLRLRQILLNLTGNAVKFTAAGHVAVRMESAGDDNYRFSVSDSGIGMTDEQLSRVFDAFTQADGSISRRYGGTGLGLTVSKKLVELMDGSLHLVSQPDCGTTVSFTLRLPPTECRLAATDAASATLLSRRPAILIVDDIPINRLLLRRALESGYDITEAGSGAAALASAAGEPPDLILLDMMMPDMDGLEILRALQGRQETAAVPVIVVTAGDDPADREACLAAGSRAVLTKPVVPETLKRLVQEELRHLTARTAKE